MPTTVAAVQMVSGANLDQNLAAAARLIAEAAAKRADLVVLPEVFAVLEGGPMRDFGEREGQGQIQSFLSEQARAHGIILVGGTMPLITRPAPAGKNGDDVAGGRVRAASLVYDPDGVQLARYDKMHLFDVKVADRQASYSESTTYEPGDCLVDLPTAVAHLGLSVCYDLRFPEMYRELRRRGAELFTVPSAFTRVTGQAHWEVLLRARAIENQAYVIAAAQGGRHNERRETWGHSLVVDPWGAVLDCVDSGEGLALASLDLTYLRKVRQRMPVERQRRL